MSARDEIRAVVAEQLAGLRRLSAAGALSQDELDRLETLAKVARLADGLEVPPERDPTDDLSDAELEARANGG